MAKVALLIGVSEYEPGLNPLPSAVRDVEAVCEVLLHPEMGGFAASDITLLKNPERQVVEIAIETLFSSRHKDDLLLLYFSGHGIKDDRGRLYLATRNTSKTQQGELIRSTAVSANFIHDRMSESRCRRQVVILDSCFSGAFAEGMSAKDDGTIDIRQQLGGEGRAVLTSSTSTQYSFEEEGQDLSIYTRFLVAGIKSGEADRDGDEFISIDELHEYASQKVRELQPAMKPEIYAIREGFKIRLAKVAPGDSRQRYRKEVARFIHRGEISFVGRRTLDVLRTRLGLETAQAKAIEDEVLEPYRNEFREKLQQYQQVFTELLERDETITDGDRQDLQNLQQILGLRNEDTMPIEAQVTARFKAHQQNLQTYQQAFTTALRQEFPLSQASRDRLRQTQQQLQLADRDIAGIEFQITAEVEAYHQKLQEYERLFFTVTQQEYPLGEATRITLRQHQQHLELTDVDVAPIEAQITTQIESYHQKLQQYEQAFVKATQRQHYPDEVTRKQLQQTWQTLGLSQGDVEAIEKRINAEIETHQANLRQYEQEFSEAVRQEYPLSALKRSQLTQRHQALNLTAENVAVIENPIIAAIEEHRQRLQQYEEVFRESIQFEYPLSDTTREELQRFQRILELSNKTVIQIEERVISQKEPIISLNEDLKLELSENQNFLVFEIQQNDKQESPELGETPQPVLPHYRKETTNSQIQLATIPEPAKAHLQPVVTQKTKKNLPWIRLILIFCVWAFLGWQLPMIELSWLLPFRKFPDPLGKILMWVSFGSTASLSAFVEAELKVSEEYSNNLSTEQMNLFFIFLFGSLFGIPTVFVWAEIVSYGWTFMGILIALGASILLFVLSYLFQIPVFLILLNGKIKLVFGANRSFSILIGISCLGLAFGLILNYIISPAIG
ncbi:MAG: caspase, EACC1-associated type [Nostoc sp. SerVER01]|nr:caspase family protein [Nostoc sp. SerVER01]